jgi:hypothetical protein
MTQKEKDRAVAKAEIQEIGKAIDNKQEALKDILYQISIEMSKASQLANDNVGQSDIISYMNGLAKAFVIVNNKLIK